ncbi:GNAT family N-acetyltransferase [Pedobacter sp. AW1-32]|uniref:GNAT family N-acetyltransferase n=1 Tax=Pedobacter sp. AW1-32 TaxID=3383026 RepID=UPI003FEDDC89
MLSPNFNPFPILETPRLLLREYAYNDAEILFEMRTNEEVMRYIDRQRPSNLQDIRNFISAFTEDCRAGKNIAWVIALKEQPDCMIGSIGYWRSDLTNHRAEVGYMLQPNFWRKGIISEALNKVIDFGFEHINLHTIQANINPKNDASRQLLLKQGFVKEAYFREDYYFNGEFLDSEIYGLINPQHTK